MDSWKSIQVLGQMAVKSEYFLQITLDKSGQVISGDSGLGPVPTLFDHQDRPIYFSDCFLSSDWSRYESQKIKAWKNNQPSFFVELNKINHPDKTSSVTKWEFFFLSEDFGTCLGIGHPTESPKGYQMGLGDFIDRDSNQNEIVDSLLENKLLSFWRYDKNNFNDQISPSLAQILGYQPDDLENLSHFSWQQHVHPEDLSEVKEALKNHLMTRGNLPFRAELRIVAKNEQVRWVIAYGKTSVWSKNGYPQIIQGVLLDNHEKKKQELWMREHHFFLRDLAFQQSHSLRARVANIRGILEIMESEDLSTDARKLLNILKQESKMLDNSLKKSIKESVQQNETWEKGLQAQSS